MDMTNIKLKTHFNYLPTEIIYLIFDYLSSNDIIYTFFFLNQRFNNIVLENQHYSELPTKNLTTWENILSIIGSQIKTLNISTIYLTLPLSIFSNLKSIIISSPYGFPEEELQFIFQNELFENLHTFKIKENKINYDKTFKNYATNDNNIFEKIFNKKNSLKFFQYSSIIPSYINPLSKHIYLHSLTLILTKFEDIFFLISYTPNLEYLNIKCQIPDRYQYSIKTVNIKLKEFYLTFIENRNDFPFNSFKLQQFLESMNILKQFHLYVNVLYNKTKPDEIINQFKTQYWFDHNWFFGIHENYFYTLPFHFDYFYKPPKNFHDIKSNNPEILKTNSRLWYYVKTIYIDRSNIYDLNSVREIKIKMPKLTKIELENFHTYLSNKINDSNEKKRILLNSVTTIHLISETNYKGEIRSMDILPNLKHLILSTYKVPSIRGQLIHILNKTIEQLDINSYYPIYKWINKIDIIFSNVQYIHYHFFCTSSGKIREYASDIVNMLNNFKNLKTLMVYIREGNEDYKKVVVESDLNELIQYLNNWKMMDDIFKNYEVKYFQAYLLFLKKQFDT